MIVALILIGIWLEINNWKSFYRLQRERDKKNHIVKIEKFDQVYTYYMRIYYSDGTYDYGTYDSKTNKKLY